MNSIVDFSLRQRVLIMVLLFLVLGGGAAGFMALNIEAYPDPVPPLIDIVTQNTGQSAEEIERYITIPLEVQMAGIPNVQAIRTISLFGLSDVKVQFTYDFTYEQAEQWVINRLAQMGPLPNAVQPQISPTSPIGEIFRYRVVGPPNYSVTDLKTLQDWVLQRRFKAIAGVIDVTGWGGRTKTYDIAVDERRLMGYGLSLPQVLGALGNANINVGGQTVNIGEQSAVVRGVGLVHSADDIRGTLIAPNQGSPVLIGDVADVKIGNLPRLGIAGFNQSDDIVQGIVLMRRGAQSVPTIKRVEAEVARVNSSGILPPGVSIERIYDRSDLIGVTTRTVLHNMLAGVALIFLLQWLFLGNLRSAFIVVMTIPFAFAFAVGLMLLRGESANLLSVGAIDFGLVVDATVIMVENIFRHLAEAAHRGPASGSLPQTRAASGFHAKMNTVSIAAGEVSHSIFFAAAIIIAGFVPLFTLSGIEGHIFGPMAKTYAYAITGGLLATFTIAPALSLVIFPQNLAERETPVVRFLRRVYTPSLEFVLANRIITFTAVALIAVLAACATRSLGLEFLPKLEEGNLWIRAEFPQSMSLEESNAYVNRMRAVMRQFPEVQSVVSQHGRPDDGTDATGFFNAEFFVPLNPAGTWPGGISKERLTREMTETLERQFPGVDFNFSQYIQDNVEEAASGVKGENSVKIYGNDLQTLERKAAEIGSVLARVPGIADLAVLRSLGQPTIRIDVDRQRAARFGLGTGDVNAVVQAAIGGQSAGDLYEGGSDRHFPMMVRLALPYRQNLAAIRHIPVAAPASAGTGSVQVVLEDVASVRLVSGAAFIYREQQQRYVPIKFSVRGRDLGSTVLEAQRAVDARVALPGGYRLEWVGEFGNLREAAARLSIAVPLSIALIILLLYLKFGSLRDALLAASVIPMAILGGIFALALTGTAFSVSAAIGFVALFGIAAMDGILVLSYYHVSLDLGHDRITAILETCRTQLRPVIMTCSVACVGLVPAAFSSGIGSQVQRPLALVVVGGMLLAPVLILLVLPALILKFSRAQELSTGPAPMLGDRS
jgi:cobalt-zinc-cadmium resistance protein CzcA